MKLNGQVLKAAFIFIIMSLCLVLIFSTWKVIGGKMPIDEYKSLLEILGIPTLIGMITQSFLHQNIQDTSMSTQAKITQPGATSDNKITGGEGTLGNSKI